MREDHDPDRRGRMLRNVAIVGVGAMTLGSCGGMLLGHYTVTGMNPLGARDVPEYADYVPDRPSTEVDWVDASAAVAEARRGAEETGALMPVSYR